MPFFYSSAELRWFLRDADGDWGRLLKWFRNDDRISLHAEAAYDTKTVTAPFVKREAERADEYLRFPDCDTVGVKQRQGKLEVKALVASPRPYAIESAGASGRIDQWVKWGFASEHQVAIEAELDRAGPWRRVVKDRYLQKYAFNSGAMKAALPDDRPESGCNIELTKITVDAEITEWLTLGFEAFGPPALVTAILDMAVAQFFSIHGPAPVTLDGRDSRSYSAWLADLK